MDHINPLVLATGNGGKVKEFKALLANGNFSLLTPTDIGFTGEVAETGATFEANALIKAQALRSSTRFPILADDSGLEVDALEAAPGIYSARYASAELFKDQNGIPLSQDAANRKKLLEALNGKTNRKARFHCVLCYLPSNNQVHLFKGSCEGKIAESETGGGGFGYDSLFIPDGFNQTFGELADQVKDELSHRAKAAKLFLKMLML